MGFQALLYISNLSSDLTEVIHLALECPGSVLHVLVFSFFVLFALCVPREVGPKPRYRWHCAIIRYKYWILRMFTQVY